MQARAARDEAVLEGRLAAFMADAARRPALKVFLDAPEPVRAARIVAREGGAAEARLQETQAREASDARRYREIYGFDYHDRSRYDLVLSTDGPPPEALPSAPLPARRRRVGG